ncbi:MAG TPA: hypothetical protein VMZ69_08920 [Saprospiraceae bacterium]|nr:hypothetical protein [Saprospiraceae bacterium]
MKKEFPQEFVKRMYNQLGAEAEEFFNALSDPSPTSIRLNHKKGEASFSGLDKVPWCDEGYYLPNRPAFHLDPFWHGGAYYVQEASSMILDAVLNQIITNSDPKTWLDVCAAPGGKTGILAKHLGPHDILIANEVVSQRRSVLRENLYKAGYLNTFITAEQPSSFKEPFVDIMLIDAPCAGEGMMRKEPEAIKQWSPSLVRECSLMQQRIVHSAIRALRPGGILIYSTCSYSKAENIENVREFGEKFPLTSMPLEFPADWKIKEVVDKGVTGYQLYPHNVKGEGLFFAVLQNQSQQDEVQHRVRKQTSAFALLPTWLNNHLAQPEMWRLRKESVSNEFIHVDAEEKANDLLTRFPRAELVAEAGQLKGKDFIPSHFLAMANLYASSQNKIELDLDKSLDYLERNTNTLPVVDENGWYLIFFQNTCIGWAKSTSQGWKNHYPLHWRLRSRKM